MPTETKKTTRTEKVKEELSEQTESKTQELTLLEKIIDIQQRLKVPKGQKNSFGGYKYRSLEDIEEKLKPLLHEHKLFMRFEEDLIPLQQHVLTNTDKGTAIEKLGYAVAPNPLNEPAQTVQPLKAVPDSPESETSKPVKPVVKPAVNPWISTLQAKETQKNEELVRQTISSPGHIKSTCYVTDGKDTITNSSIAREAGHKKGMDDGQLSGATISYVRKYAAGGLFLIDDTEDMDRYDNNQDDRPKRIAPQAAPKTTASVKAAKKQTQVEAEPALPKEEQVAMDHALSKEEAPELLTTKEQLEEIGLLKEQADADTQDKWKKLYKKKFGGVPIGQLKATQTDAFIKAISKGTK